MNYALKGHAMKRGTLMFLKRILLTALGALGLGAFAAGTASAQQIPAPDIFDDQITCSMRVPSAMDTPMPSVIPMGATMSTLDTLIGMGTAVIDTAATGMGTYEDLGYVIPPDGNNCGSGTAFVAATDGSVPTDVAMGYSSLLTLYQAVYGDPGDTTSTGAKGVLDAASMALAMGIADGAMGATLTLLQDAVTRAQEAFDKAKADFNAQAGGPIYQAGVSEWMAKAAVTQSVADYNTQVTMTNAAQANLDGMDYDNADGNSIWVPLGNTELFAGGSPVVTIADGMGTVNIGQLVQYSNGDLTTPQVGMAAVPGMGTGDGTTGNEAPVASDVTASNFDAAGNLIIPMEANTDTADDLTDLRNTISDTNGVDDIRTIVENANIAAAALKKARDENIGLNQDIYDEAYRRAQAEADYYNARWAEVLAHNVDTRTDIQKLRYLDDGALSGNNINEPDETTPNPAFVEAPITIASRNAALTAEQNKRFLAEQDLRNKVSIRETATALVRTQFTDAQSFYAQLVARREALRAGADGADAVEAAQEALDAARMAQTTINGLFDDENDPTVDLVNELLMADADGDDGQALVDAISDNYGTTQENEDRLDGLLMTDDDGTESGRIVDIEESVAALTGDGTGSLDELRTDLNALTAMDDPETMEDETGAVTMNTNDITSLDGRVAENESDIGQIQTDLYGETSGQHGDLAACDATGLINVATCADARSRHNEADIEETNDKLAQKKEYIDNVADHIGLDPVTGEGTGDDGMSRVDMIEHTANHADEVAHRADEQSKANAMEIGMDENGMSRIDHNEMRSMTNAADIEAETMARMEADDMLGGRIDAEAEARMKGDADEMAARMAADEMLGGRIDAEEAARMKGDADEMAARMAADEAEMNARMAADEAEMNARMAADEAEMNARMMADEMLGGRIDAEAMARTDADMALGMRIDGEAMARADGDMMLGNMIMAEEMARMEADTMLGGRISSNADAIASNMNSIGQNRSMINDNRNMIGELSDDLDVVRAGVAASMALAGMPAINGRGISIGVGSYDGESAFAVGFQIQGEQASFKIGVTSSGGETGASAGVGFNF